MEIPEGMKHAGRELMAWEVDEYPRAIRSGRWYAIAAVVGAGLIIYSVVTQNFLFAVIVLMLGVITLVSTFREPNRIEVIITTAGIVIGEAFYDYRSVNDFSIAYNPPKVKQLYFSFRSVIQPLLSIPLENVDPNEVRSYLIEYCRENLERTEETLTDTLRRVYKV